MIDRDLTLILLFVALFAITIAICGNALTKGAVATWLIAP